VWNFHRWWIGIGGILIGGGSLTTLYRRWKMGTPIRVDVLWGAAGGLGTLAILFTGSFFRELLRAPRRLDEDRQSEIEALKATHDDTQRALDEHISQAVAKDIPRRLSPQTQQTLASLLAHGKPGKLSIYFPYLNAKDKRERETYANDFKTTFELGKWEVAINSQAVGAHHEDDIVGIALAYYESNPPEHQADLSFLKQVLTVAGIPYEVVGIRNHSPYTGSMDTLTPVIYIGERE
jgi:hypothetical protein